MPAFKTTEKLFSYGTLRYANVQRTTFGRLLSGAGDSLPAYRIEMVTIDDPHVLAISREREHPMLIPTGNPADSVEGMVFDLTDNELLQADSYEVDSYKRVRVTMKSGVEAWAYVSALHAD